MQFEQFYLEYGWWVHVCIRRRWHYDELGDTGIDDAEQTVLILAWRHMDKLDTPRHAMNWIRQVCLQRTRLWAAQHVPQFEPDLQTVDTSAATELCDHETSSDLATLPLTPRQGDVIRLLSQGYDQPQIASTLGMSHQRVSQLVRDMRGVVAGYLLAA